MNKKQTKTSVIFIFFLFLVTITPSVLAYKDVTINVEIKPRGIVSEDYNVVGDIFYYNVTLENEANESIDDVFIIRITPPNNQTMSNAELYFNKTISPKEIISIIPYINFSKNNNTYIWPFVTSGDYTINICSQNQDIKFIKNYTIENLKYLKISSYYFYNCFPYYFSAMSQWQYQLFTEQKAAAEKTQEADKKLIDLTIDLDDATKSMKTATWIMVGVAIITLIVALLERKN